MVYCGLTLNGSLIHSTGAAVAKPRLPLVFLGWTQEIDDLFPHVRLLNLGDKYRDWERFMAFKK